MSKAKKAYSLWLVPYGKVYDQINDLILYLSKKYNTPYFKPHVTLLGEVFGSEEEIFSKTAQLSAAIKTFEIELDGISFLDEYFKCLFIKARENAALVGANKKAKEIFGRQSDLKYAPHMGIMYGKFTSKIKKEIIKEIGEKINLHFDVSKICIYSTNGEVKKWHEVNEFLLTK